MLTFRANGNFTSEEFAQLSAAESCGDGSHLTSGNWRFGSGVGNPMERGAYLQLTFPGTGCAVTVFLFGEVDDPVMCPTVVDPDVGCDYDEYLGRVAPAAMP
ncbi:hypothetical protein OTB20_36905 [Streptomyces sp. H27-H1]|nr:hypothetical protein [Streptomyces sp. H27-H1]